MRPPLRILALEHVAEVHDAVVARLVPLVADALERFTGGDVLVEMALDPVPLDAGLVSRDGGLRVECWAGPICLVSVPVGAVGLVYGAPGELEYLPDAVESEDGTWITSDGVVRP